MLIKDQKNKSKYLKSLGGFIWHLKTYLNLKKERPLLYL